MRRVSSKRRLYLVSCVSKKRSKPIRARELYYSDWFQKARAYVESRDGRWFILSAKYGLVAPGRIIAPYNVTLHNMTSSNRRAWAEGVAGQLRRKLHTGDTVVLLAGETYRQYLVLLLRQRGCEVEIPMRGLGIGQQLRWLKRHLA